MLPVYVAELAQSAQKRVDEWVRRLGPNHRRGRRRKTEDTYPVALARRLGASAAGHREGPEGKAADEGTPVHQ